MALAILTFPASVVTNTKFLEQNKDSKQLRLTIASNCGIDPKLVFLTEQSVKPNEISYLIGLNTDIEVGVEYTKRIGMLTKIGNFITLQVKN